MSNSHNLLLSYANLGQIFVQSSDGAKTATTRKKIFLHNFDIDGESKIEYDSKMLVQFISSFHPVSLKG